MSNSSRAKRCAAVGCKSNSQRIANISFFRIPAKIESAKIWIERIGRHDLLQKSFRHHRICSLHFNPGDIFTNNKRMRLKSGAVPNAVSVSKVSPKRENSEIDLEISSTSSTLGDLVTFDQHLSSSYSPEIFVDFSQLLEIKSEVDDTQGSVNLDPLAIQPVSDKQMPEEHLKQVHAHKTSHLSEDIFAIKRIENVTPREIDHGYAKKRRIVDLKAILDILKEKNLVESGNLDRLEELCVPVLVDIDSGILSKLSNKFTPELRALILNLNFYSPKAYSFVRENILTGLPQPNILCDWYKNIDAKPGFTSESFDLISEKVTEFYKSRNFLFLNLVFDEIAVKSQIEWTGTRCEGFIDAGDGTETATAATLIFVVLVVCVRSAWKIPIGFFPITSMTAEQRANIIIHSIHAVSETGAKLIGVTCDGSGTNISTGKILGCDWKLGSLTPTFKVSGINDEFLMILDPINMIKLVRNTLASRGPFLDRHNTLIDWNYLKKLVELPEAALNKYFSNDRIKLTFASQILSDSVADALEYCSTTLNLEQFRNSEGTVKFIRICNKVFEILNSRKFYCDGYEKFDSLSSSNYKEILTFSLYAINYFSTLKLPDGQLLVESLHKTGFIGLILGLKSIETLHSKYISSGLLTDISIYKLSKNHIDLFFDVIKHQLKNTNPTVGQFITAYRKLIVGNNTLPLEELPTLEQNINSSVKFINSTILNKLTTNDQVTSEAYRNIEGLNHLLDAGSDNLNEYHESIIAYIAGVVVFRLQTKLKCEQCIHLLETDRRRLHEGTTLLKSLNLAQKYNGKLKIASEDVLKICLNTEKVLKHIVLIQNDVETSVLEKTNYAKVLIKTQTVCKSKLIFKNSTHIHKNFLIRAIIEEYLTVKEFYMSQRSVTIVVFN